MKKINIFLFASFFCLAQNTKSQMPDSLPCPQIILIGPANNKIIESEELSIKVKPLQNEYKVHLLYNWSIDNGTIVSGQGTNTINIFTEGLKNKITATVQLIGLKSECPATQSITIKIVEKKIKLKPKNKRKT